MMVINKVVNIKGTITPKLKHNFQIKFGKPLSGSSRCILILSLIPVILKTWYSLVRRKKKSRPCLDGERFNPINATRAAYVANQPYRGPALVRARRTTRIL